MKALKLRPKPMKLIHIKGWGQEQKRNAAFLQPNRDDKKFPLHATQYCLNSRSLYLLPWLLLTNFVRNDLQ
jgi:hypothetical protein